MGSDRMVSMVTWQQCVQNLRRAVESGHFSAEMRCYSGKDDVCMIRVARHNQHIDLSSPFTTQGPSWGYLKVNFSETLSIFGDRRPRNGSKNGEMAPRTGTGCPHIGPCEEPCISGLLASAVMSFQINITSVHNLSLFLDISRP